MSALSVADFDQLISSARWLWRWEAQPGYHEPEEAEPFALWQAGEPDDLAWLSGWLNHLRTVTSNGRRFERVRVIADPPTEYQTWSLTIAPHNIDAGEDLRLIEASEADELGLPLYDFVIVDDQVAARMVFGVRGFVGAELVDDPDALAQHREWRAKAWQHAITVSAYTSRSP